MVHLEFLNFLAKGELRRAREFALKDEQNNPLLSEIIILLYNGLYKSIIDKLETKTTIKDIRARDLDQGEDELLLYLIQIYAFVKIGEKIPTIEAFSELDRMIKSCSDIIRGAYALVKATIYDSQGMHIQAIAELKKIQNKVNEYSSVYLFLENYIMGIQYYQQDFSKIIDKSVRLEVTLKENNYPYLTIKIQNMIALVHLARYQFHYAERLFLNNLEMSKELENLELEAISLGNLGELFLLKGDFNQSKHYLEKADILEKQTGNLLNEAITKEHLGNIAEISGDLSLAVEYYKEALTVYEQYHKIPLQIDVHLNMAKTRFNLEFPNLTNTSIERAIKLSRELNNPIYMVTALYYQTLLFGENDNLDGIKEIITKMRDILLEHPKNDFVISILKLIQAEGLFHSDRPSKMYTSLEIYQALIDNEKNLPFEFILQAHLRKLDLLFIEFASIKSDNNKVKMQIFNEIINETDVLLEAAKNNAHHDIQIRVLYFKSDVLCLAGKYTAGREILQIGRDIANNIQSSYYIDYGNELIEQQKIMYENRLQNPDKTSQWGENPPQRDVMEYLEMIKNFLHR